MKFINSSLFRALCTLIVGVLLIMYPDKAKQGLIVAIGLLFIIPGLATVVMYYVRKHDEEKALAENPESALPATRPMFPLAGWGSLLLGVGIILMKGEFLVYLHIILAAILILLSIATFITLVRSSKYWHIGLFNYIMPIVVFIVGALIIFKVLSEVEEPTIFLIIGLAFAFYGLVEIYFSIRIFKGQHDYKKRLAAEQKAKEEEVQIENTLNEVQAELDEQAEKAVEENPEIENAEASVEKKDIFD